MPDDLHNDPDQDMTATGTAPAVGAEDCACPYCAAVHSGPAAEEARTRIAAEEAARFGAAEARSRAALDAERHRIAEESAAEIAALAAAQAEALQAAEAAARTADAARVAAEAEADRRMAATIADLRREAEEAARTAASAAEARVAEAAARAARDADAAARADSEARTARLEAQLSEMSGALTAARSDAEARLEAAEARARAETAAAREEAAAARSAAEARLAAIESEHALREAALETRMREVEGRAEAARAKAVLDVQIQASEDKLRLQEELRGLQRKLEEKSNKALGEEGEADILGILRAAFPDDEITHVGAGNSGADVVHTIRVRGEVAGRIVYDAKNRKSWRSDYVSKLREDLARHQADHAVLACLSFPAGAKQLHVEDGVIVASPARVEALAQILRKQIVETFRLRLSGENRAEKAVRLYEFIASEQCEQLMGRMSAAAVELDDLAEQERRWHERHWKQRANVLDRSKSAHSDLAVRLASHIGLSNGPEIAE